MNANRMWKYPSRARVVAFLVIFGLVGGTLYLGVRTAWNGYRARQARHAAKAQQEAAFNVIFQPCFDRLNPRHVEEERAVTERRLARTLNDIPSEHEFKRRQLRDQIEDLDMEERHDREYTECLDAERRKQGQAQEVKR